MKMTKTDTKLQVETYVTEWEQRIFFFCVPQTVLHFLGIGHDRARGPGEQHTQVSEMPADLNKNKTHKHNSFFLLRICHTKSPK